MYDEIQDENFPAFFSLPVNINGFYRKSTCQYSLWVGYNLLQTLSCKK